eukprot:7238438-Prymnesium_polylepis.1
MPLVDTRSTQVLRSVEPPEHAVGRCLVRTRGMATRPRRVEQDSTFPAGRVRLQCLENGGGVWVSIAQARCEPEGGG